MAGSRFARLFPEPRFLRMEGGGLEVSDGSIKYVRLSGLPGANRKITSHGEEKLPQNTVVGGEIRNKEALITALSAVRRKAGFRFVHASLPEQKGYLFDVRISADAKDISEQVALAIPEHVPLSPAECVYDCEVVPTEADADARVTVASVFPESLALDYAEVLNRAGFEPLSFELEPQAAQRAVLPENAPGAHILVDFGENKTVLSIVQGGSTRFTSSFEGSGALDQLLLDKTGGDPKEVIRLKTEEGLAGASDVAEACTRTATALAGSIDRTRTYWQTHAPETGRRHEQVASVVLYGGNANMRGLADYLARAVNIPCGIAEVWKSLAPAGAPDTVPAIEKNEMLRYATPLGLALRSGYTIVW